MSEEERARLAELRTKYNDPLQPMTGAEIEEMYRLRDLERVACVKSRVIG